MHFRILKLVLYRVISRTVEIMRNWDKWFLPLVGPNALNIIRYWCVLSIIFLAEMFLEQITLSPGFSLLKLLFLVWCVLPIDSNGTSIIYEQVRRQPAGISMTSDMFQILQPVFKVSSDLVNDVMRNKFLEELLETLQEMIRNVVNCIQKLSKPKPEPTLLEKLVDFCWSLYLSLF